MENTVTQNELTQINSELTKNSDAFKRLGLGQLNGVDGLSTIDEALRLREDAKKSKGTHCRCCGQKVKLYKRKISAKMAVSLILFHDYVLSKSQGKSIEELGYFDLREVFSNLDSEDIKKIVSGFTRLKYWDCIAPMPTRSDRVCYKKGFFTITDIGVRFVLREIALPGDVFVYNDTVDSFTNNRFVTIDQILEEQGIKYDEIYGKAN